MHNRGDLSHFLEDDVVAELPWEPTERYEALAEAEALGEEPMKRARRVSKEAVGLTGPFSAGDSVALADVESLISAKKMRLSSETLSRASAIALEDTLNMPRGRVLHMMSAKDASPTEYTYDPVSRYNALAHTFRQPKGAKTIEEEEILRQSNPDYGSLMPRKERPSLHELTYDPSARYHAMAKLHKLPRGSKSLEHLENLRQSDPAYGSLMPSKERVGPHEISYEPLRRFAALAKTLKPLRGAKTTEHLAVLRLSDPAYGSLMPSKERADVHELTYNPVARYAALAKSLKAPRGAKTTEHLAVLRLSDPAYGSLMPAKERAGVHELTYDPVRRFAAMAKMHKLPRGAKTVEHIENLRLSDPAYGSLMPSKERAGVHELTYDPVRRFAALAKSLKLPRGSKTTEHLAVLRLSDPSYGSLMPSQDRPSVHEISYDPLHRYNAMAKLHKLPRGSKSLEHLENLRQSDPAYGSLMPSRDRVGRHELTYDPVRRFAALAKSLKAPRGAKTTEHLENLRLSAPTYGSLMPSRERPGPHEISYEPTKRYASLARLLKEPRGQKPFEHLRNLRLSDPSLGSLSPKRTSSPDGDEDDEEARAAAEEAAYEARYLQPMQPMVRAPPAKRSSHGSGTMAPLGRLPRILSNQAFEPLDDDDDDLFSGSSSGSPREGPVADRYGGRGAGMWAPPKPSLNPAFFNTTSSSTTTMATLMAHEASSSSDRFSARDSLRSDARTSLERMSERSSNDTIASFLDEADPNGSGEWNARDLKIELGLESSQPTTPLGTPAGKTPLSAALPTSKAPMSQAFGAAKKPWKEPTSHAPPPLQHGGVSGA